MARMIDSSYLLKHQRKVKFFGLGPDDESWGYAVPTEIIENAPTLTPPNEPLTLDELREMDEPVWIKRLKGLSVCDTGWAVVDVCPNQIRVWWFGSEVEDEPSEKDYGETWLAYRRPPEEEHERTML